MKLHTLSLLLLGASLPALLGSCNSAYAKDEQGVTVNVDPDRAGGARKVRLQVLGPKIIRVSATPTDKFSADTSLVVIKQEAYTDFDVKQENDSTIRVSTPEISATVSTVTGQVSFFGKDGKLLLGENAGGRKFEPIEVDGTESFSVQQTFASPDARKASTDSDNIRPTSSTTKARTRSCSSTTPRCPCPSSCRPAITAYSGTAIRCCASAVPTTMRSSAKPSSFSTRTARKAP